jgi:hypothetical protein
VPYILKTRDNRDAIVVDDAVPKTLLPYLFETFGQAEKRLKARLRGEYDPLPPVLVFSGCWHAKSARNFAAVSVGNPCELFLCNDLAEQPATRIRGILWHELGHVLIHTYGPPTDWEVPGGFGMDSEQLTDYAVELLCGVTIYYDEDLVQRAGPGYSSSWTRPRPRGLR